MIMMEKFPKTKIETGETGQPEKVVELGSRVLRQELTNFRIPAKRVGALAFMTLLAMGFVGAGKAEAQTRYRPNLGQQAKREATRQVNRGVSEAMTGVNQAHYNKIQEAGQERSDRLTKLSDYEMGLDGDFQNGKINQEEYSRAKNEVRKARESVEKEYRSKVSRIRLRQNIFQSVRSGIRGF